MIRTALVLMLGLCFSLAVTAEPARARTTLMISDTHMGLGKDSKGSWERTEDFRWPEVLEDFLTNASNTYGDNIDLLVLGDFLELWQSPKEIRCAAPVDDLGCTPEQMAAIAAAVIKAHSRELESLRKFAERGENRLILLPGNHDSALLLPQVWKLLEKPLNVASGRVSRTPDGTWQSADKLVFAEHGHQIGRDANKYQDWPTITAKRNADAFMIRPWGEQFVQSIFNAVEEEYPVIDNLSPESAGVRYRIAEKGQVAAAKDAARFLLFNVFETSLKQKSQILGDECKGDPACEAAKKAERWDLVHARKLGNALALAALKRDDPFRQLLEEDSDYGKMVRDELQRRISKADEPDALTREEILQLCDQAAIQSTLKCQRPTAGAGVQRVLYSKESVLLKHLRDRKLAAAGVTFFVYGHTHQLETPWRIEVAPNRFISVANTGGFQRLIDEEGFKARMAAKKLSPDEALRKITHDDMPACYTYVVITRTGGSKMQTLRWYQPDGAKGLSVEVGDKRCN